MSTPDETCCCCFSKCTPQCLSELSLLLGQPVNSGSGHAHKRHGPTQQASVEENLAKVCRSSSLAITSMPGYRVPWHFIRSGQSGGQASAAAQSTMPECDLLRSRLSREWRKAQVLRVSGTREHMVYGAASLQVYYCDFSRLDLKQRGYSAVHELHKALGCCPLQNWQWFLQELEAT